MPVTVTGSNSVVYHVWQLPALTTPEPVDITTFATLDIELTDGYRSGLLTGFSAGTRSWQLTCPTLASLSVLVNTVTGPHGGPVSREQYVRALFAENKISGKPFVYLDEQANVYRFVDFADNVLSLQRMRIKLFTTGLRLNQRRLSGVTLPSP